MGNRGENAKPSIFAHSSSKVHVMENKVMERWDGGQVGKVGGAVHCSSGREIREQKAPDK